MRFRQAAPPGFPILGIADARLHLRLGDTEEDVILQQVINAVNARLDGPQSIGVLPVARRNFTGLGPLLTSVICDAGPAAALVKVEVMQSGVYVDVTSRFVVRQAQDMTCLVRLALNNTLPTADADEESMRITLLCGYAATAAEVPPELRQAALLLTSHWFENRSAAAFGGGFGELPMGVRALIRPFCRATE